MAVLHKGKANHPFWGSSINLITGLAPLSLQTTSEATYAALLIYKSPWGYCYVTEVSKQNDFTLIRPGFLCVDNIGDYIMHSDEEVFRPLKLGSFINSSV